MTLKLQMTENQDASGTHCYRRDAAMRAVTSAVMIVLVLAAVDFAEPEEVVKVVAVEHVTVTVIVVAAAAAGQWCLYSGAHCCQVPMTAAEPHGLE